MCVCVNARICVYGAVRAGHAVFGTGVLLPSGLWSYSRDTGLSPLPRGRSAEERKGETRGCLRGRNR